MARLLYCSVQLTSESYALLHNRRSIGSSIPCHKLHKGESNAVPQLRDQQIGPRTLSRPRRIIPIMKEIKTRISEHTQRKRRWQCPVTVRGRDWDGVVQNIAQDLFQLRCRAVRQVGVATSARSRNFQHRGEHGDVADGFGARGPRWERFVTLRAESYLVGNDGRTRNGVME